MLCYGAGVDLPDISLATCFSVLPRKMQAGKNALLATHLTVSKRERCEEAFHIRQMYISAVKKKNTWVQPSTLSAGWWKRMQGTLGVEVALAGEETAVTLLRVVCGSSPSCWQHQERLEMGKALSAFGQTSLVQEVNSWPHARHPAFMELVLLFLRLIISFRNRG